MTPERVDAVSEKAKKTKEMLYFDETTRG